MMNKRSTFLRSSWLSLRAACLIAILFPGHALAGKDDEPPADAQSVRELLLRIQQLEARVQALEAEKASAARGDSEPATPPAGEPGNVSEPQPESDRAAEQEPEAM